MYINRILLLVLVILYVFSPLMADWIGNAGAQWYRPHLLWLAVIGIVGLAIQRDTRRGH